MQVFSIYKATNKNNDKAYIGHTSDFYYRKAHHKSESQRLDRAFYRAIRKYGWETFEWEIICQSKDGQYIKEIMEPHFIKYYNTFGQGGYNMTAGGDGCTFRSEESKRKQSETRKGMRHSEEAKRKMGLAHRGKKKSPEHMRKFQEASRQSRIGIKFSKERCENISKGKIEANRKKRELALAIKI